MPAGWDPKESKDTPYERVHKHDSGMFSFTMDPPFGEPTKYDAAIQLKLRELKDAIQSAGSFVPPQPIPRGGA